MGFLKNLLNPKNAIKGGGDPFKTLQASLTPEQHVPAPNDPQATNPAMAGDQSGSYFGDQSDPSFGSFTKPFDVTEFYKYEDPGYEFRRQQGEQSVRNAAGAGSGALSGAALKDLLTFNQDSASQEFNNSFNRNQTQQGNIFSRLLSIAGLGQGAAAGVGNQGVALAGNAGQAITNAGTATGSGIVGGANAITGGATNAWLWNQMNQPPRPVAAGVGGV